MLTSTTPLTRVASVTKLLGFMPMRGKVLVYSSWFRTSFPPSKLLIQMGLSIWAIFINSSIAASARSTNIDLSCGTSLPTALPIGFIRGIIIPLLLSSPIGNMLSVWPKLPYPFIPTARSNLEFVLNGGIGLAEDVRGLPKNLLAKAQTRPNSSVNRAFSILNCCCSSDTGPGTTGPPQLLQIGSLMFCFNNSFSSRSLSLSCLRITFSCRSNWVWSPKWPKSKFSRGKIEGSKLKGYKQVYQFTFIWVLLFWNQNLICLLSKPSLLLSSDLCFSSGWGHSLKKLLTSQTNRNKALLGKKIFQSKISKHNT